MASKAFKLVNKTALITGAAGLLGVEHSNALLECDCNLVLTDIDSSRLDEVEFELKKKFPKPKISKYVLNVRSKSSIIELNNLLISKKINLDILINNAALNPKVEKNNNLESSSRLENFPLETWDLEISVGLTGAFLCSQIFGSTMANSSRGGCILNIASDLSVISPDQRIYQKKGISQEKQPVKPVTYSVIKSGLIGLTKYLATYWIGKNIRCNSLSPGGIYTTQPEEFLQKISELIPLGRMARRDEYRAAVQFLCSDASSYMNGHNLIMDGGRSIW